MWLAFCAPNEALEGVVLEPEKFMEARESLVLGYSDQVPVWVKLGPGKQLLLAEETKKKGKKNPLGNLLGSHSQHSQKLDYQVDSEGCTQLRGDVETGSEKYRMTVELRQHSTTMAGQTVSLKASWLQPS